MFSGLGLHHQKGAETVPYAHLWQAHSLYCDEPVHKPALDKRDWNVEEKTKESLRVICQMRMLGNISVGDFSFGG